MNQNILIVDTCVRFVWYFETSARLLSIIHKTQKSLFYWFDENNLVVTSKSRVSDERRREDGESYSQIDVISIKIITNIFYGKSHLIIAHCVQMTAQ